MDPLGQVFLGEAGTGAALILGDSGSDAFGNLVDRLNAAKKAEKKARDSVAASMSKLQGLDKVGWFRHNEELGTMRKSLVNHTTNIYVAGGNPFAGEAGLKTAQLQGDLKRAADHSQQIRELYKLGTARIEGKQENFTPESIKSWADYFTSPLSKQLESLPPSLVEHEEVLNYMKYIDDQSKNQGYSDYTIKKDGVTTQSKSAREAGVRLRVADIIVSPEGKAAIKDKTENHGMTQDAAESWIDKRYRSNLDNVTKQLESKGTTGGFTFNFGGAASQNYRFEYQVQRPTVGIGTMLVPGAKPEGAFEEVRMARTDATENKPIFLKDPTDPTKTNEISVIPISVRRYDDGRVMLNGKKVDEYGDAEEIEIPYEDVENAIRANFDGFVFDDFMRELDKQRGGGAGLQAKKKVTDKAAAKKLAEKPVEEEIDFSQFKRKK